MSLILRLALLGAAVATMVPGAALAYVGPGAGLGMIGSLIAVVGAILVAIVGLLILPFRMLQKRRKAKVNGGQDRPAPAGSTHEG